MWLRVRCVMSLAVMVGLSSLGGDVFAQNSPDYHARHNAQSPYYVGSRGEQEQKQMPVPNGYWQKTWGAIAANGAEGLLGTAVGASSEEDASKLALQRCSEKGGGCKVELTYFNQCAALTTGDELYNVANARSIERASEIGLALCKKEKDTNCRVYYSACTEPIYHKF